MDEPVTLSLTKAEALVLFDLVFDFRDQAALAIRDDAEKIALWNLTCLLEKALVEPFREDYDSLLAKARTVVRERGMSDE